MEKEQDLKKAVQKIAEICAEVFELTGRSVPSNHNAKIKEQVDELNELIKELQ